MPKVQGFVAPEGNVGRGVEGDLHVALAGVLREVKKEKFDKIIIDTAPTGHALRLLSLPEFLQKFVDISW